MEPEDASAPAFTPGDYLDDAELERLLPKLGEEAGLAPDDFVDERHLDNVIGLVSQSSRRKADKAEEWQLVTNEQGKIFCQPWQRRQVRRPPTRRHHGTGLR
jgi:hypothetical protein